MSKNKMHNSNTTAVRDYCVHLETIATDENGIAWGRTTSVLWDEGVTQDWQGWLNGFNSLEDEPYRILNIIPCGNDNEF